MVSVDKRLSAPDVLGEPGQLVRVDPHCHILPGIDDGAPTLKMSYAMARRAESMGIRKIVATPHGNHPALFTDVHPDRLRALVAALNDNLLSEGIGVQILPGTEVYLSEEVPELFDAGELITWADQGRHILVELGFQHHCAAVVEVCDYFLQKNIVPIIAHPERYAWLPCEGELIRELDERGCIFQFNMMSINGHFGPRVQQLALRLIPVVGEWIIGTDSHSDAAKYFDFRAAEERLAEVGAWPLRPNREPVTRIQFPDLNDLRVQ